MATLPLKAVLVDDEAVAIDVFTQLLKRTNLVDVVASETNANMGLRQVVVHRPDILFLDIQMAKKTGIDFLKELEELCIDVKIVVVSGFDDYVFDAFKYGAVDYLVKPVVYDKLRDTINRISDMLLIDKASDNTDTIISNTIKINAGKQRKDIIVNDIVYLKASGSYSIIFLKDGKEELCTRGLWLLEKELPVSFVRIHRSTLINCQYLHSISESECMCELSSNNLIYKLAISQAKCSQLISCFAV